MCGRHASTSRDRIPTAARVDGASNDASRRCPLRRPYTVTTRNGGSVHARGTGLPSADVAERIARDHLGLAPPRRCRASGEARARTRRASARRAAPRHRVDETSRGVDETLLRSPACHPMGGRSPKRVSCAVRGAAAVPLYVLEHVGPAAGQCLAPTRVGLTGMLTRRMKFSFYRDHEYYPPQPSSRSKSSSFRLMISRSASALSFARWHVGQHGSPKRASARLNHRAISKALRAVCG